MAEKQSSDMSPSPPPLDIFVENSPKMMMWMNPIPMECGVLSGGDRSTPRFTISVSILYMHTYKKTCTHIYLLLYSPQLLKKLLVYARNKGKHAYPWLRYVCVCMYVCMYMCMSELVFAYIILIIT